MGGVKILKSLAKAEAAGEFERGKGNVEAVLNQIQSSEADEGYGPVASAACKVAAGAATRLGAEKEWKAAAQAGDLFHPSVWVSWRMSPDGAFEKAASLLTKNELRKLAVSTDPNGANWAAGLALSARRLSVLRGLGLSPSERSCKIELEPGSEVRVEAGFYCAWNGQMDRLDSLREADVDPPGRQMGVVERWSSSEATPETALQAFALSLLADLDIKQRDRADRVARWLCSGELGVDAVNTEGDDALKMAIRAGAQEVALALLDWGARPEDKNARGESAFEALEKEMGQVKKDGWGPDHGWGKLAPRLSALREASALMGQMERVKEMESAPRRGDGRVAGRPRI